jgi:hypothetical protein
MRQDEGNCPVSGNELGEPDFKLCLSECRDFSLKNRKYTN